ncbi:hypothetical protein ESY86_13225 [Subsaximicrobium wynnwilliamsii]|uniref:Uncharacterized protein n=1 Tax=Subsaximicrobium wynnwilliamsii TaxID=291179 RepID=A0A5C6ZFB7_9FLAO|nr:hypothetical protein [Subsaximicrobium wynnwilliamsii]TXD83152.1 hypothetical protein ESY87_10620 [Subsaximicrobium wynnwilliamsii]TXD88265.1 hypothetical protein ESY86_13225 [Subsaximicrobium wynnwilliamsii]TXE02986.1 hypothetical protein ESY88_09640 [Subsaximicrobium wynnwilliamsii]
MNSIVNVNVERTILFEIATSEPTTLIVLMLNRTNKVTILPLYSNSFRSTQNVLTVFNTGIC